MDPAALQRLLDSSGLLDLADLSKCLVVAAALGERGVAAADGARDAIQCCCEFHGIDLIFHYVCGCLQLGYCVHLAEKLDIQYKLE